MDKKIDMYKDIEEQIKYFVRYYIDCLTHFSGLKQKDIAINLSVSPATICFWYSGVIVPSLMHFFALKNLCTFMRGRGGVHYD